MFWKLERTSGSWQALLALMKNWMISWVVHLLLRCLNPFLLLVTRSNYPPHLPLAGQALAACGLLPCFVWWCEIPTEVLRILSRSWFPIFSVHSDFICKFDRLSETKSLDSLLSPSGRRWLKAGWESCSIFPISSLFPLKPIPHPPLTWSPLSQNGRGLFQIKNFSSEKLSLSELWWKLSGIHLNCDNIMKSNSKYPCRSRSENVR